MKNIDLFLGRIKMYFSSQGILDFDGVQLQAKGRSELLSMAIRSRPVCVFRGDIEWRVANLFVIDKKSIRFCFGKTGPKKEGKLENGDFVSINDESSEYIYCFLNLDLGICGIQVNSRLGKNDDLFSKLLKTISSSYVVKEAGIIVDGGVIENPKTFLQVIEEAKRITKFTMTFSRPNPWDEEDARKNLAIMSENIDSYDNRIFFSSKKGLKKDSLPRLTRATVSSGDTATIRAMMPGETKVRPYSTQGSTVKVTTSIGDIEGSPKDVIEVINGVYENIRHGNRGDG